MGRLSFEETFLSDRWGLCQFAFIIALSLINGMCGYNQFQCAIIEQKEPWTKAEYMSNMSQDLLEVSCLPPVGKTQIKR